MGGFGSRARERSRWYFGASIAGENEKGQEGISEEVENKYLTMSWWMLHVGWKDVRERVRRGVEEVFDGCVLP
jgi:hypothetical protein